MLGDQLLRNQKGITQKELADYLHISKSSVGMWEHGQRDPDTAMLLKIADFYEVTVDYLLGRESTTSTQQALIAETIRKIESLNELTASINYLAEQLKETLPKN
ncbi:MAG: helix-turn-helix transcriptional regulator [Ruminococcus sp.]|nr:helix-turn-helix transcriptional regulator [Ruminococcus sp.]